MCNAEKCQDPELCLYLCSLHFSYGKSARLWADQNCSSWEPNLFLFSLSGTIFFLSSTPQYFMSESIQFRSLLMCVVWDNGTRLTFYTAFLPITMTSNNVSKQTLLFSILHNSIEYTFSAPEASVSTVFSLALFMFWLNDLKVGWGILISYIHSINLSVKESTIYCPLLSVHYLLTSINVSLYM